MNKKTGKPIDIIEEEFGKALGATEAAYREKVTLYLAHKDRKGSPVPDIESWIQQAESVLSGIGGGATSLKVRGAWLGDRPAPLHEGTTLVYSFATPQAILDSVKKLKKISYTIWDFHKSK